MKRNNNSGFVFVMILCIIALFIMSEDDSVQEKSSIKEKPVIEKQPTIRVITVSYHVHLDSAYTGASTYFLYKDVKTFKTSEKAFSMYGLSTLYEIMFDFQRISGEKCKSLVNLQMNKNEKNALIRLQDSVFPMNACVLKKTDCEYAIFIAPSKKEADSMMKNL